MSELSPGLAQLFTVAFLLTGDRDRAEEAVLSAIENKDTGQALLTETIILSLRSANTLPANPDIGWLPPNLQPAMLLPRPQRSAFVLRFLAGWSAEASGSALHLSAPQVNDLAGSAAALIGDRSRVR